jgi:hypothetical protein
LNIRHIARSNQVSRFCRRKVNCICGLLLFCVRPPCAGLLSIAGHDPDLVTSLLPSLLQIAHSARGSDDVHVRGSAPQDVGLDAEGLPTAAFLERQAIDARTLADDLLADTMLRVLAVGDASVLLSVPT